MIRSRMAHAGVLLSVSLLVGACATPYSLLKLTRTGGDAPPVVEVDITGNPSVENIGGGDVVAISPGALRAVVAAPEMTFTLIEPTSTTEEELEEALKINPREYAKIDLVRGIRDGGVPGGVVTRIVIDKSRPNNLEHEITTLAFNRSDKAFRGDLTIFDSLPPELEVLSISSAAHYTSQSGAKAILTAIPIFGLFAMNMDEMRRTDNEIPMKHSVDNGRHKFELSRLVIEPGEAVGYSLQVRYVLPEDEDLLQLREYSRPYNRTQPGG